MEERLFNTIEKALDKDFYEIYDIYGENEEAWNKYFNINEESSPETLGELKNILKNVNMDNVQKHINNAQKAVNLIQELTKKNTTSEIIAKTPRPITKFFGD